MRFELAFFKSGKVEPLVDQHMALSRLLAYQNKREMCAVIDATSNTELFLGKVTEGINYFMKQ